MLKYRFPASKVLFYCHFPQQLVTPSRFFLYRWYSIFISIIEARMYESADIIMVNSKFTATQFKSVMPTIPEDKIRVVYPPCDVDSLSVIGGQPISRKARPSNDCYTFLSMNRFWPEKRLDIILDAAVLLKQWGYKPRIKLAGSVMPHIPESRIYYELLQTKCMEYDIMDLIEFIPSPSEEIKFFLYRECDSALYTPPMEHFGIVPIEALEQRRPVIVIDSGGPAETIKEPCGRLLAEAMVTHMKRETWEALDCDDKYKAQRERFDRDFSLAGFGSRIDEALTQLFPSSVYQPSPKLALSRSTISSISPNQMDSVTTKLPITKKSKPFLCRKKA